MAESQLHGQNVIACVWDFDKTLIPGYMQTPIFRAFGVDERRFWKEVTALPERYLERGNHVSKDTIYLNHLLSYVRNGPLRGLSNRQLRELGAELEFYPGLPGFFRELKNIPRENREFQKHDITVEHYIISTGLAEMIRGSAIAQEVDGIFGCEFIEEPFPPGYLSQPEFEVESGKEITQIGTVVDNTIKTRYIFEINKGSNKDAAIDVNANIRQEDRRVPLSQLIYVADGPSDVPVFSVVRRGGGLAFAVYDPSNPEEFAQNDRLLQSGRIHSYGPADYRAGSSTAMWLRMHITAIGQEIVQRRKEALALKVKEPPRHLHKPEDSEETRPAGPSQPNLFEG